jgi:hypothetical protein
MVQRRRLVKKNNVCIVMDINNCIINIRKSMKLSMQSFVDSIIFNDDSSELELFCFVIMYTPNLNLIKQMFKINGENIEWLTIDLFHLIIECKKFELIQWLIEEYPSFLYVNTIHCELFKLLLNDVHINILKMILCARRFNIMQNNHEIFLRAFEIEQTQLIEWFCDINPRYHLDGSIKPLNITKMTNEDCPICGIEECNCMAYCGHSFCMNCMQSSFDQSELCPFCREVIVLCITKI